MAEKVTISVLPDGKSMECDRGTLLLDALYDLGVIVRTPCGGKGLCGKCGIIAEGGLSARTPRETELFPDNPLMRLSCQTTLLSDTVVTREIPEQRVQTKHAGPAVTGYYGFAVDLGTTTIQVSLVDLSNGSFHQILSLLNPQRRYGHDIISRIAAAAHRQTYASLVSLVRTTLMTALSESRQSLNLPPERLKCVSFSGNTTMSYFLMGLDVAPIGVHPYTAAQRDFSVSAADIGIEHTETVRVMPVASSFLGGDLVGGLAVSDGMGYTRNTLFIDLGTNGEIFLRNGDGEIYATSCAMGPALEGMNISHGMTADEGAITHVEAGPGGLNLQVEGGGAPLGICGTGIIDAVALLLNEGIIRGGGSFNNITAGTHRFFPDGVVSRNGVKGISLHDDIIIDQRDIRNIQLARGAALSAARILLQKSGMEPGDIEHVLIAGAFGANLNTDSFKRLGFIPEFPGARYVFLGNTSLRAAEECCLSAGFMDRARSLRDRIRIIELSEHPGFNDEFIRSLDF